MSTIDPTGDQALEQLVAYDLAEDGPALYPAGPACWWCSDERHNGVLPPGSSCPVRHVGVAELSPARRALRERGVIA